MSCDFMEPFFGASYPDACCIDGLLWDLDSCDEPGGALSSGGDTPCPQCNHEAFLDHVMEELENEGACASFDDQPRQYRHRKIFCEAVGDEEKCRAAWLKGYDEFDKAANEEAAKTKGETKS